MEILDMVRYLLRYLKISQIDRDIRWIFLDTFQDICINCRFIEISMNIFWCICNVERYPMTYFEISWSYFKISSKDTLRVCCLGRLWVGGLVSRWLLARWYFKVPISQEILDMVRYLLRYLKISQIDRDIFWLFFRYCSRNLDLVISLVEATPVW